MNRRALEVVAALPHGPQDPAPSTPPRQPGSVRRTTSVDQRRGAPGGAMEVIARGRDLLTRADGTVDVIDEAELRVTLDAFGTITGIESDPPEPGLVELVGGSVSRGFRARVDTAVPDQRDAATVLHLLLDDLPMAALISNYGSSREQPEFTLPPEAGERLTDLCAGWAAGATMLGAMASTGIFPIPVGPPAPDLAQPDDASPDDPLAWHDLPPMAPRSVRRRRRLDLAPGAVAGQPLALDVHFRDSHLGADDPEDVLHEYELAASIDPDTLEVRVAEARARVLPWPECPQAVGSAERIVGHPVSELRALVSADFTGTSTCTHLNDVLRSLASVTALRRALTR